LARIKTLEKGWFPLKDILIGFKELFLEAKRTFLGIHQ